jgi:hypothetical protein
MRRQFTPVPYGIGTRIGYWTITALVQELPNGQTKWRVLCDCGGRKTLSERRLRAGRLCKKCKQARRIANGNPVLREYSDMGFCLIRLPQPDPVRYATYKQRKIILERDGFRCRYCGNEVTDATANMDHVVPYHKGGPTRVENLVTCCHACNKKKGGSLAVSNRLLKARNLVEAELAMYV